MKSNLLNLTEDIAAFEMGLLFKVNWQQLIISVILNEKFGLTDPSG